MPNLNDITILINTTLIGGPFVNNKFKPAKTFGICEAVKKSEDGKETSQPSYFDTWGEGESVAFDDTNTLMIFHRVESISYSNDSDGYGNADKNLIETANMRLVFTGQRNKMNARPENVLAAIELFFLKELTPAQASGFGVYGATLEMGDANLDSYSVWDQEFQGIEYGLVPEIMMFSIPYKIISTFNKGCFILCS